MSSNYWLTPEEIIRRKKRNKNLLYFSLIVGTAVLSTLVTFLANTI